MNWFVESHQGLGSTTPKLCIYLALSPMAPAPSRRICPEVLPFLAAHLRIFPRFHNGPSFARGASADFWRRTLGHTAHMCDFPEGPGKADLDFCTHVGSKNLLGHIQKFARPALFTHGILMNSLLHHVASWLHPIQRDMRAFEDTFLFVSLPSQMQHRQRYESPQSCGAIPVWCWVHLGLHGRKVPSYLTRVRHFDAFCQSLFSRAW